MGLAGLLNTHARSNGRGLTFSNEDFGKTVHYLTARQYMKMVVSERERIQARLLLLTLDVGDEHEWVNPRNNNSYWIRREE